MAFRKLQLNLLSQSGELINCVNCFAGQISVFRAPSYAALEVYQRALAGIPGPERISIFLDDRTLIPSEHFFVGFGEHREGAHEPVLDSFLNLGLTEEVVTPFLASYDVEISSSTPWNALSKCEARRVRLLLATRTRDQVIILNDPFEPLANQWRERFADLMVTFARQHKAVIVVTNLSFRPESWIDNQTIARIQVGEEIQRTIGFGAQAGKGNDLVSQIREIMKDDAKVAELLGDRAPSTARNVQTFPSAVSGIPEAEEPAPYPVLALAICGLLSRFGVAEEKGLEYGLLARDVLANPIYSALIAGSVIVTGGLYLSGSSHDPVQTAMVTTQAEQQVEAAPEAPSSPPEQAPETALNHQPPQPPVEQQPPAREERHVRSALDEYPDSIRKSILASFQSSVRSSDFSLKTAEQQPAPPAPREEAGELLRLLETASDTGEGLPDAPPPSSSNDNNNDTSAQTGVPPPYTSEEAKREAIRKRFLEAIERAQNLRRQQVTEQGE